MEQIQQTDQVLGSEFLILQDNRNEYRLLNMRYDKSCRWRDSHIKLNQLIGKKYNHIYEVEKGKILECENGRQQFYNLEDKEQGDKLEELMETEGKDNRNISNNDVSGHGEKSQTLTPDQIAQMKQNEEISKSELIDKIAENNTQIDKKTAFCKEKWKNKKKKRHLFLILIRKVNLESLLKNCQAKNPKEIMHLRQDSFGFFLYTANVSKGSRVLMFDCTRGLALGGIATRLNGQGVIHVAHNPNFDSSQKKNSVQYFNALNPSTEVQKSVTLVSSTDILSVKKKYSHLLVAGDFDTMEIIEQVENKLDVGGIFCLYSPHIENLTAASNFMHTSKAYVYIQLSDTFMRTHQVLKERTHPIVETSTFSGYVLRGMKVQL